MCLLNYGIGCRIIKFTLIFLALPTWATNSNQHQPSAVKVCYFKKFKSIFLIYFSILFFFSFFFLSLSLSFSFYLLPSSMVSLSLSVGALENAVIVVVVVDWWPLIVTVLVGSWLVATATRLCFVY